MLPIDLDSIPMTVMGALLGAIGFLPLSGIVAFVRRGRVSPSVSKGIAATALSFAYLMTIVAAAWALARPHFPALLTGILVGFFASWVVLAIRAMRRRF